LLLRKTILPISGIFLCLLLLTPGVSAYAEKLNLGSREIIMNMTWPEPDDVHYCDVVPCYMRVTGQVFGSDIQNVTVTHGNTTLECGYDTGKYFLVNCSMKLTDWSDQVVLTVRDSRGAMASVTRNVFFYTMPGPESIWVDGYVLDTSGVPIKDAVIDFQSFYDNRNISKITRTDLNGWYSMKRTYGYTQNITVHKEGYGTISRSATFRFWNHDRLNFTLTGAMTMPFRPVEPGSSNAMLTQIVNICSNWHLWCNHLQEKTKDTNPSLENGPSITSPEIIQETNAEIKTTTVPVESPNLSSAVVKPGDMVSIDLIMGDNNNNISINSRIALLAGQTTRGYGVIPGTSDQSPGSRIFELFSNEYNAISLGIVGMKLGEQKNISVHFKDKIETKVMSSEYLKRYKINSSNLSAGKLFVGTYIEPNSSSPPSTVLGKVVSATRDYAQVDFSYPDIHVRILIIENGSTNMTPSSLIGTQSPAIQRVSPMSGPTSGGTLVTITGTNLSSIQTINFGKSRANSIRNVSDTIITAITPPSEPGVVSLFFQAPQWLGLYDGFTFIESTANTSTTEKVKANYPGPAIDTSQNFVTNTVPAAGPKRVFTESDNGRAYEIPRNTEFFVNVTESFATGTKWHPKVSSGLEILNDEYYANPKSVRVDIGGTRSWKIRAAGTGKQSFQADFYQFSDSDKVQQHYALTLNIRPG